jgi:general secretion pathway protein E
MQPAYGVITPLLGEVLVAQFGVGADAIERGLLKQREDSGLLGEILVALKLIDEDQLAAALAIQAEMPSVRDLPRAEDVPADLIDRLPINFAKQHVVLPMTRDAAGRVSVAIADPTRLHVVDDVAMLDANDEAPIIRWVNSLMFQAVKDRASDIHIEPGDKEIMVRNRVDGVLHEVKRAPKVPPPRIIARVKIMAGLNIAEKRLPQDGRIRRKMAGKDVDMRVATVPTATASASRSASSTSRRCCSGSTASASPADHLRRWSASVIKRPHGILLVTGPTGSGKTTTLYSALSEINTPDLNILTVEDPVEYQLAGISQTQVNPKIDLTFASACARSCATTPT